MQLAKPSPAEVQLYAPSAWPAVEGLPQSQGARHGPPVANRAARRRLNREAGHRGSKARRANRPALPPHEVESTFARRAEQQKVVKVVESARAIREATGGSFWLPGD